MEFSLPLMRSLFFLLIIAFFAHFSLTFSLEPKVPNIALVAVGTAFFAAILMISERLLKKLNLRIFNLIALGLLFGYLMGDILLLIFQTLIGETYFTFSNEIYTVIKALIFLTTCYGGTIIALRMEQSFNLVIPFIQFESPHQKRKNILLDPSLLIDQRLIDLIQSGLIDQKILIPRFVFKEIQEHLESKEEAIRTKARKELEAIKKIELLKGTDFYFADVEVTKGKEGLNLFIDLAHHLNANILTAEFHRFHNPEPNSVKIININFLSHALKPLSATGESLQIKILRYGKEPLQGVGYLDDGTMVVVNGGAKYLGETIKATILFSKPTSTGRIIFCNAALEEEAENSGFQSTERTSQHYTALKT